MNTLAIVVVLIACFGVTLAALVFAQTWVRLSCASRDSSANYMSCVWVAIVTSLWCVFAPMMGWSERNEMFASLLDQRMFFVGITPALFIIGFTSVVAPWAYKIRPWLLSANLFAVGLFYGLMLGTAAWTPSVILGGWLFWSAVGFGGSILRVVRSKPPHAGNPRTVSLREGSGSRTA